MSPTCGDLISECSAQLHGWGSTQDRVTPLTANIGLFDTSFTVDFTFGQSVGITPGVVEIDSEQMYVTFVDANTGICTLANGFGRGYGSTTAATHTAGARVISRPKFPRVWLFKQINEIIGSLAPELYAVQKTTTVVTFPINSYPLNPGPALNIFDVQWQDPIGNWNHVFSYDIDAFDGNLRLGGDVLIGRPLRIIYSTEPNQFVSESDDFVTTTGLPASCSDVLTLGVVAKQVPGLDISRAQTTSVEQSDRAKTVPPNQGINAAKYLMAEFQDRLKNEAVGLRKQYQPRMVRTF
jgi:hypothetical protein